MDSVTLSNRHPKSLVIYPKALCTEAWTQMNVMVYFNESIFAALGHGGFSDRSSFAHSSGYWSAAEISRMDSFYAVKYFVKLYCRQWKWDSSGTRNYMHTSFCLDFSVSCVCFQFSFACLVWFTGDLFLLSFHDMFQWQDPTLTLNTHIDIYRDRFRHMANGQMFSLSLWDCIFTQQLTDSWKECVEYWLKQQTRSFHLTAES